MTAYGYKDNIPGTSIGNDTLSGNSGSITSGATSLKYATAPSDTLGTAGLRSTAPFIIAIGTELIIVGANTAGTKTASSLTRGAFGTTAAAHNDGDAIDMVLNAQAFLDELALLAPLASPTFTGTPTAPLWVPSGLSGATTATRYVGGNASGPPTSGTFAVGDFVVDQTGNVWICTSAGSPGTWKTRSVIGCRVYNSQTQTLGTGTGVYINGDTERFDTNSFHFTSAANLTGTVTKASGSAAIVGSSTLFTTELSVNQAIAIPGTATEIGVVKTITDNTHLTLWQNMANSASGQTATRRNDCVAIPANFGGTYLLFGGLTETGVTAGSLMVQLQVNGVNVGINRVPVPAGTGVPDILSVAIPWAMVPGDYFQFGTIQAGSTNPTTTVAANYSPEFGMIFQGS